MTNQAQKIRINKINTQNAIAYASVYTIEYAKAYTIGYAKHMFIVLLFIFLFLTFNCF